jgi:SAM-dependent methyltransferase
MHAGKGMLSPKADAYGGLVYAHYKGLPSTEIIERDDHWFGVSAGASAYFAPFEKWPSVERRAMQLVRGRVLDVGCGAGRVALHLQARGHEVVAVDVSPLAVKTCRLRGVRDARVCSVTRISRRLGEFDTIVMLGNNFGLFGNPRRARWLLRRFHGLTSPAARIVAESRNPYKGATAEHRQYHQLNRRRGKLPGQLRIRVRYGYARTPWFDYLIVSASEMREIVAGTGWRVAKLIEESNPIYIAVLEKVARSAGPR